MTALEAKIFALAGMSAAVIGIQAAMISTAKMVFICEGYLFNSSARNMLWFSRLNTNNISGQLKIAVGIPVARYAG